MKRLVVALVLLTSVAGAAVAMTSGAHAPADIAVDLYAGWCATARHSDGPLDRIAAFPVAVRARLKARRDAASNRLCLNMWGSPLPARKIYAEMLAERGIQSEVVSGCVVRYPEIAAWTAYNDVMLHEIRERHGERFLETVLAEAESEYEARKARSELPYQRAAVVARR